MIYGIDYQKFHPSCEVEVLQTTKGLLLHCKTCRLLVDIAEAGQRISHSEGLIVGKVPRKDFHFTSEQQKSF